MGIRLRKVERPFVHREICAGWDDVEVLALDEHSICSLQDLKRCVAGEQIHHHAFMGRIEVLDQNERHSAMGRYCHQEFSTGFEAACGRANADNLEVSGFVRWTASRLAAFAPLLARDNKVMGIAG